MARYRYERIRKGSATHHVALSGLGDPGVNDDMPFDEFTIEQLAGDMLPNATRDQLIATGFHRNTMTNEEGGLIPRSFDSIQLSTAVATTGTVWLGLTLGCTAQCHTHKFDPLTHQEYYAIFALFNNSDEVELPLETPEIAKRRTAIEQQIAVLTAELSDKFASLASAASHAETDRAIPETVNKCFNKHFLVGRRMCPSNWQRGVSLPRSKW